MKKIIFLISLTIIFSILNSCAKSQAEINRTPTGLVHSSDLDIGSKSLPLDAKVSTGSNISMNSTLKSNNDTSNSNLTMTAQVNKEDDDIRMSFLAAGDNIIHSSIYDDAKLRANAGETYNFRDMYNHIRANIQSADISYVNQETPIAGDQFPISGYPMFNSPKEAGLEVVNLGFDIVNIANNHMLDKGEVGYKNNISFFKQQPILLIGGYTDQSDYDNIRIYEKNGVKIAFLSYTYGTNGMFLPKDSKMIIPLIDETVIKSQVIKAKEIADLVFVSVHWGNEDEFKANASQRSVAQVMVDNGVDVIIGMHPHVIQEMKEVVRPDGGTTLIAYSLGNFISTMEPAKNMLGALMTFDIVRTSGKITIENPKFLPIVTHYNLKRRGLDVYFFEDYTEELATGHGSRLKDSQFSIKYLKKIVMDTINPKYLSDFFKN